MATHPSIEQDTTILGNRYEVEGMIGEGAAAHVYRVRDRWTGAVRAAKVLKRTGVEDPQTLTRFEDEYRILRTLHHPSLPEVHDYGWIGKDEGRYIIMDLVAGERLDDYFKKHPEDFWILAYELCEVLVFIHSHNLLHQDIKPSNILVRRTRAYGDEIPMVTLLDFGLTYRRDQGQAVQMVGTAEYMAPEVIVGEAPLTRAVDYYSLGATLFELLTGTPPFTGSIEAILRGHLKEEAAVENERLEWAEVYPHVYALLSKDKKARLEAYESFRRALMARLMGGIEALGKPYGLAYVNSLGMIGKEKVWEELLEWLDGVRGCGGGPQSDLHITGPRSSGKTYLLQRLVDESVLRGCRVLVLGQHSMYALLTQPDPLAKRSLAPRDIFALVWDRIADHVHPLLVLSDGVITPEEQALMGYIDRRRFIDENPRLVGVTVGRAGRTSVVTRRKGAGRGVKATGLEAASGEITADSMMTYFHGRIASRLHGERFRRLFKELIRADEVFGGLERCLVYGHVRYSGGVWECDAEETAIVRISKTEMVSHSITKNQKSIVEIISCGSIPLSCDDLAAITDMDSETVSDIVRELVSSSIAVVSDADGRKLVSLRVGYEQAYEATSEFRRAKIHAAIIGLFSQNDRSEHGQDIRAAKIVAEHVAVSQSPREAWNQLIRRIKQSRKRNDIIVAIELCEFALELCERHGEVASGRAAKQYFRFSLIRLEDLRRNDDGVRSLVRDFYGEDVGRVPRVLLPTYVRSLAIGAPRKSRRTSELALRVMPGHRCSLAVQVSIAGALAAKQGGDDRAAMNILNRIQPHIHRVPPRWQARFHLYRALCGDHMRVLGKQDSIKRAIELSSASGAHDEFVLGCALQAHVAIMKSKLHDALVVIAPAVRYAVRNHVDGRLEQLYNIASAAYYERGQHHRSVRYLLKMEASAMRRGHLSDLAKNRRWLAMNYERMGLYGAALQLAEQSLHLAAAAENRSASVMNQLTWLDVMWLSGRNVGPARRAEVTKQVEKMGSERFLAYLHEILGDADSENGDYEEAEKRYGKAIAQSRKVLGKGDTIRIEVKREGNRQNTRVSNAQVLARLGKMVATVESIETKGRYANLRLSRSYRARRKRQVQQELRLLEPPMVERLPAELRLRNRAMVFRAYARMGDQTKASETAQEYSDLLRRSAASFDSDDSRRQFLKRADIIRMLDEIQVWKRVANHANEK